MHKKLGEIQPRQLNQNGEMDIPQNMMSCFTIKAGQRRRRRNIWSDSICLSITSMSPPHLLLYRRWLNICLLMENKKCISRFDLPACAVFALASKLFSSHPTSSCTSIFQILSPILSGERE